MSENLSDFLFNAFMIAVFIAALTLFFVVSPASERVISVLEGTINDNDAVIEIEEFDNEHILVTGAEIIGNIISGIETDIYIDGTLIETTDNPFELDFSFINEYGTYREVIIIDSDGKVEEVHYYLE
jgi:hypothetical protein